MEEQNERCDDRQTDLASDASLAENNRTLARKSRTVILLVAAGLLLLGGILAAVSVFIRKADDGEKKTIVYSPVYEGNILECREYLALDRLIVYSEDISGYGLSVSLNEENITLHDEKVRLLYRWICSMTAGDAQAYNACFTGQYLHDHGAKNAVAQQMLYQIRLAPLSSETDGEGGTLTTYRVTFLIHQNNGTLFPDTESDRICIRNVVIRSPRDGGACGISDLISLSGR